MDTSGDRREPPSDTGAEISEPEPPLQSDIVRDAGDWASFEPVEVTVAAAIGAIVAHRPASLVLPASVCIALSNDAAIADLNRAWRAKDQPTNVLSFPAPVAPAGAPSGEPRFLGDVVLAAETVAREARQLGLSPAHHLQHLVVHGILHLIGFTHEDEREAVAMESLETEILASIGVADPYADSH